MVFNLTFFKYLIMLAIYIIYIYVYLMNYLLTQRNVIPEISWNYFSNICTRCSEIFLQRITNDFTSLSFSCYRGIIFHLEKAISWVDRPISSTSQHASISGKLLLRRTNSFRYANHLRFKLSSKLRFVNIFVLDYYYYHYY